MKDHLNKHPNDNIVKKIWQCTIRYSTISIELYTYTISIYNAIRGKRYSKARLAQSVRNSRSRRQLIKWRFLNKPTILRFFLNTVFPSLTC